MGSEYKFRNIKFRGSLSNLFKVNISARISL